MTSPAPRTPRAFPAVSAELHFNAPDDVLAAHLDANTTLLATMQARATALHHQLTYWGQGLPARSVVEVWQDMQRRTDAAAFRAYPEPPVETARRRRRSMIDLLRVAVQTVAIFEHMAGLNNAQRPALADEHGHLADTPEAQALIKACPALAAWKASRDERVRELERRQAEERRRLEEAAPAAFIEQLKRRGVVLQLGEGDTILAPPGTVLTAMEMRQLREQRDRIIELLKQPSVRAAAAPVVLA